MTLNELLEELTGPDFRRTDGSDLHLVRGEPPVLRRDGLLHRKEAEPLDSDAIEALLLPHLTPAELSRLDAKSDVEKTLRHGGHRFRLHVFRERGNLAAAVRVAPNRIHTLAELGLSPEENPVFQQIISAPHGLVLVVGPTGSGKQSTVAAMVEEINRTTPARIMTIDETMELEFEPKQGIITQQVVPDDIHDFPTALRGALRWDPDVLLISERTDLESILLMLQLAETGHLVFTTMHTNSVSEATHHLSENFAPLMRDGPIRRLVAQQLVAVVHQRLLPRADRPGRVAVQEILVSSPRIRQMIVEGQTDFTVAIEAGRSLGMKTMDDHLMKLFAEGIISRETTWFNLENKDRLISSDNFA